MKILYYNWAYFNGSDIGGGVGIYQKNIIDEFLKNKKDSISFLFSGEVYSPFSSKPFIKKIKEKYGHCKIFALVNSTVVSPAWYTFYNLKNYLNQNDTSVLDVITDFINKQGGFDVLHLNNLEGLPLNVLRLKERFPKMKIVYTIHNYMPFCPSVNLFCFHKHRICDNYHDGCRCMDCCKPDIGWRTLEEKYKNYRRYISPFLGIFSFRLKRRMKHQAIKLLTPKTPLKSEQFKSYRKMNVEFINKYVDVVLSVSKRVKDIATQYGIEEQKNFVSYIGTKVAENQLSRQAFQYKSGECLKIAYLGYAREDKGFFFLLDGLKKLDEKISKKIELKLIAKGSNDSRVKNLLKDIENKFQKIDVIDGYTHDNMAPLLKGTHLGIIPVIWEDNLPQVAIELVSMGIPILCSSAGGASELSTSSYFKFKVADIEDFNKKLSYIQQHPSILKDYWAKHNKLVTMNEHIQNLLFFYQNTQTKSVNNFSKEN